MATFQYLLLLSLALKPSQGRGGDLVAINLAEYPGESFSTGNSARASCAFRPESCSFRRYWDGSWPYTSNRNTQRRYPAIWFRFDEPIGIAMISFDSCDMSSGCSYRERKDRGPEDYKVIAAKDCGRSYDESEWRILHTEYNQKWKSSSPVTHELHHDDAYRCWGIQITDIDNKRLGPAVADFKFWSMRCSKFELDLPSVQDWDCGKDLLGSKCLARCDRGKSPFGRAVCRRSGKFVVDEAPEELANNPGANLNAIKAVIGCEYQCKRPEVEQGRLVGCSRPKDGAMCEPKCDRGFTDIHTIHCNLIGNKTLTENGKEYHPYEWKFDGDSVSIGLTGTRITPKTVNFDLTCTDVALRGEHDCERGKQCNLHFLNDWKINKYLGKNAVVNKTAVVVTYNDVDQDKWRGSLPSSCPSESDILNNQKCISALPKQCYVAARVEKSGLSNLVLGDGKKYGGCENRPLSTNGEEFLTVIAVFQLADGTIRKLVLLREPKQLTPTQIAIVIGVLVGIVFLICGCCVLCNRSKIFKKRGADSSAATNPPAAAIPPDASYPKSDAGMPLMPVPAAQPPPPAQYPYQPVATYPQAPYPPAPGVAPPPQAPYPTAPPAVPPPYAPTYPDMAPGASGMQPVAGALPYPPDPMAPAPPPAAPYP